MIKKASLALMVLIFAHCSEELDAVQYVKFFNKKENGLNTTVEKENTSYSINLRSREYMALMNIGPEAMNLSKEELKKEIENTEDFTYVFFKIKNNGEIVKIDSIQKIEQINYFQSGVLSDTYLINNGSKISPCLSTYVSSNNLINEHTLILAFPISFRNIDKNPTFQMNKSKFITKDIIQELNIKNKNSIPQLSL